MVLSDLPALRAPKCPEAHLARPPAQHGGQAASTCTACPTGAPTSSPHRPMARPPSVCSRRTRLLVAFRNRRNVAAAPKPAGFCLPRQSCERRFPRSILQLLLQLLQQNGPLRNPLRRHGQRYRGIGSHAERGRPRPRGLFSGGAAGPMPFLGVFHPLSRRRIWVAGRSSARRRFLRPATSPAAQPGRRVHHSSSNAPV